jgi:hypothetical protein
METTQRMTVSIRKEKTATGSDCTVPTVAEKVERAEVLIEN